MKKIILKPNKSATFQPSYSIPYEQELNAQQLEAVLHKEGPALVVAGAGTGKTRTLVYRVARLVESGVHPQNILLLTFTRKAAQQMLRRASVLLDGRCQSVRGGTFHSYAHTLLRRYADVLGFSTSFTILDRADAADLLNLLKGEIFAGKKIRIPPKDTLAELASATINLQKSLSELIEERYPYYLSLVEVVEQIITAYHRYKKMHALMDYDDLLVYSVQLLREHPTVRRVLSSEARYIMVDEYQDTNYLQHQMILELAHEHRNILVVGDDAQSIYGFRGARYRNILEFPECFPDCRIIKLEENFRSTQPILDFANEIMRASPFSYAKTLYTRKTEGSKPWIVRTVDERQQSQYIVQQILDFHDQGIPLREIAVLCRAAYHTNDLEIELQRARIPFQKFGGMKFVEAAHIKDVIAHLRLVYNPKDRISWQRVLLLLKGVGSKTAASIIDAVESGELSIDDNAPELSRFGSAAKQLRRLFSLLQTLSREKHPADQVYNVLEYYRPLLWENYENPQQRWNDLETFLSIAERFTHLEELLADLALEPIENMIADVLPVQPEDDVLTISTVHSAKGLEWKVVFVLWMVDGRFPSTQSQASLEEYEEERRLFYVACTRAKEQLILTYPEQMYSREQGRILTVPSPFLTGISEELGEHFLVVEGDSTEE